MSDLSKLDAPTTSIIKDISSAFAMARSAQTTEDPPKELKCLLRATSSIILLLELGVPDDIGRSYSATLLSSSVRIRNILFSRAEDVRHTDLLVYIAGAYTGDTSANIAKAEAVSIALIRNGWHVITPHKNTSGYEQYEGTSITKQTWLAMDLNLLSRCDLMYVMDNWKTSSGAQSEVFFAKYLNIPIFYEESYPATDFVKEIVVVDMKMKC